MDNSLDYDFCRPVEQRAIKPKPVIRNHHDWKIHKRLKEAWDEQRSQRILLMMGRGNGKTRLIEEELERVLTRSKPEPVKFDKTEIKKFKDVAIDWDLYSSYGLPELQKQFEEYWYNEMLKEYIRKDTENWRPKVYLDTSLINPRDWYNKQLTIMDSVLGSFIVASED